MSLWIILGRTLYRLAWPALAVYLYFTERTRVIVHVGDDVLAVKGWFGDGKWSLPGGGLRRNEDPKNGLLRELHEETGVTVSPGQIKPLFTRRVSSRPAYNFRVHAFMIELPKKPGVAAPGHEIVQWEWIDRSELLSSPKSNPVTKAVLSAW